MLDMDSSRIAAKRWRDYINEERQNKTPKISWNIIEIILKVVKWIIYNMERLSVKKRRIVQKISVE
ncbi:MAG: hypothetical protein ACRD8Z_03045 [Nitrososphaeraceae archaeon]